MKDKDDGLKMTSYNDYKMIFQYKQIRKFPAVEAGCFPPFARVTERSCGELWISEVKALNSGLEFSSTRELLVPGGERDEIQT